MFWFEVWVEWMGCGWNGWVVGGMDGLWVEWMGCGWNGWVVG